MSAPAAPCRNRATISQPTPGAIPQASDAAVNPASPQRKIRRRPCVAPSLAPVTSSTA